MNKYRGDFPRDVFLGRAGEEAYVAGHAQALGWQLDRPVMVVVGVSTRTRSPPWAPGPGAAGLAGPLANASRQVAATVEREHRLGRLQPGVVTLVPVDLDAGAAAAHGSSTGSSGRTW